MRRRGAVTVLALVACAGVAWPAQAAPPPAAASGPVAAVPVVSAPTSASASDDPTTGPVPDREAVAEPAAPPLEAAAPESLLVRFEPTVSAGQERDALADAGTAPAQEELPGDVVVVPVGDQDAAALAAELEGDPRVAEVAPDHVRAVTAWTDDPELDVAWPYIDLVRLPRAWDVTTGTGVVVAVLDTGVAPHPDLAGALLPGWDAVNGDADATDDHGHGTAVAGVAAARGDNGIGSVGAAWGASVLPVKVLDASGRGTDADVIEGIGWAVDHGADVINLSLGGPGESPFLRDAVRWAVDRGVVVVMASGNSRTGAVEYPAAYAAQIDGALAVGAVDDDGTLAPFSSWGDEVTVVAPGVAIAAPHRAGGIAYPSGTSFSTPLVSGVAALVEAQARRTPAQVEAAITSTARDAGPRGTDPFYGRGVLDAAAALGTVRSVPLDRLVGDGGADDLLEGAVPLAVGAQAAVREGALETEGDADWVLVQPSSPEDRHALQVQVTPAPGFVHADVAVEIRDGDGRLLSSSLGTTYVEVDATGPWFVRVAAESGAPGVGSYRVVARRTDVQPAGPLVFAAPATLSSSAAGDVTDTVLAEVTGDGVLDVVRSTVHWVALPGGGAGIAPAVRVLPGLADGRFGPHVDVRLGTERGLRPQVGAADLDGDGVAEVYATASAGTADDGTWRVRADGGVLVADRVDTTGDLRVGSAGVVPSGDAEALVASAAPGVAVLRGDGAGGVAVERFPAAGAAPHGLVDVDRDGRDDVVSADGTVLLRAADGAFAPGTPVPAAPGATSLVGADVDGDGIEDVVSVRYGSVVLAHGGRGFAAPLTFLDVTAAATPAPADMDGDGRSDLVVPSSSGWVLLGQRADGTFAGAQYVSGGGPSSQPASGTRTTVRDHDGDGDADLVYARADGGIGLLAQVDAWPPLLGAWVEGIDPARHASGVATNAVVAVRTGPDVAPGSVGTGTVRLVDGAGVTVPSTVGFDAAAGVATLRPTQPLVRGSHYEVVVAGLTATDGSVQDRPARSWFTVAAGGERFTPVAPSRVLNTIAGVGASGRVTPGAPITVDLSPYVPPEATAVVLNVTAVTPSAVGNVRVYPTPATPGPPPMISNLNVVPGVDQPNLVTVMLGVGQSITLANDGMLAHLLGDLAGYYSPGGATAYEPVDPVRLTHWAGSAPGTVLRRVPAGQWVDLTVAGVQGVPVDASAVVLNVTGVAPSTWTNVRVYPTPAASEDQEPPFVSNLNLEPGRDQPNLVTVPVGDGGRVRLYTQSADVSLIADLAGYYAPTGDHGFHPLEPARIVWSGGGIGLPGPLQPGVTVHAAVAGQGGVPSSATAAVLNVTAVYPQGVSNVRVFPRRTPTVVPFVSNLNPVFARDEPNLAIVRLGDAGQVSVFSESARTNLIMDVAGYFTH
ncbi:S8 family serine peptidase [Actinotalea solisilvae]|uniref:S8 family serine peptidase n=1 Tax=Actinotalea solisilvae TaxID=2072922 RepID=UPI0018F24DDC|nr:S8 family serine peptidase [Actinotalea solisilvae]